MMNGLDRLTHAVLSIGIMLASAGLLYVAIRSGTAVLTAGAGPETNMGIWYLAVGTTVATVLGFGNLYYGWKSLVSLDRWLHAAEEAVGFLDQGRKQDWQLFKQRHFGHLLWMLVCGAWAIAGLVNLPLAEMDEEIANNHADLLWQQGKSAMVLGVNLLMATALQIAGLTWLREQALDYLVRRSIELSRAT